MRKLPTGEVKERKEELSLSPAFVRGVEAGNIEMYACETEEEITSLLTKDCMYLAEDEKIEGLRVNGVKLGWVLLKGS